MKKFTKMFAFASLASLAVLSGCSESEEPDPTKAELCAAGVTRECVLGTWTMDGVKSIQNKTFVEGFDFSAAPGSLEFYVDVEKRPSGTKVKTDMFKISWPAASPNAAQTDCNPVYGTWSVSGNTLVLNSTINNMCFKPKSITIQPTFTNNGLRVEMEFGRLWLNANQISTQLGIKEESQAFYTEVFSIDAKQK